MEIKPHQAEQIVKGMQRAKVRAEEFEKIKTSDPNDVGTIWGKFGFYSPLEEFEFLANQSVYGFPVTVEQINNFQLKINACL